MDSHTMKRNYRSFDFLLAALVIGMAVFGVVMIGSATDGLADIPDYYGTQKFWAASGAALMLAAAFVDYHFIGRFYIIIYAANIALLLLVLVISDGDSSNTDRWIRYGPVSIQPSEFCKIFMIVFLAVYIEKFSERLNEPLILLLTLGLIALPVALVAIQPSLSASLVVGAVSVGILFAGRLSYKYILPVIAVAAPAAVWGYFDLTGGASLLAKYGILKGYQIERIMLWLYPDVNDPEYFQTMQSIRAIGSGLFDGKGLYNGDTVVPYSYHDFIFAVIGEELGFAGCVAVLACVLVIVMKCLLVSYRAVDTSGRLMAAGAGIMLAFQTFVHVGVATGILPNTGTPLPFVSYGGSSMWISMVSVGLCLNIGMTKHKSFFEGGLL